MADADLDRAPRWRSTLAALADLAVGGTAAWALRRGGRASFAESLRLLGPSSEIVREQLRSPGQRLLGVRTVDQRTGRRLELWRSLAVLGAGVGGQLLAARLKPPVVTPEQEAERQRFHEELSAIHRRNPLDPAAAEAERRALYERHPGPVSTDLWRQIGPALAITLVNNRLRHRLATTTEVLVRSRRAS